MQVYDYIYICSNIIGVWGDLNVSPIFKSLKNVIG